MSALLPKADIVLRGGNVCFVPKADILRCDEERGYSITSSATAPRVYLRWQAVTDVDPTARPSAA
jgi:hypothetical protein